MLRNIRDVLMYSKQLIFNIFRCILYILEAFIWLLLFLSIGLVFSTLIWALLMLFVFFTEHTVYELVYGFLQYMSGDINIFYRYWNAINILSVKCCIVIIFSGINLLWIILVVRFNKVKCNPNYLLVLGLLVIALPCFGFYLACNKDLVCYLISLLKLVEDFKIFEFSFLFYKLLLLYPFILIFYLYRAFYIIKYCFEVKAKTVYYSRKYINKSLIIVNEFKIYISNSYIYKYIKRVIVEFLYNISTNPINISVGWWFVKILLILIFSYLLIHIDLHTLRLFPTLGSIFNLYYNQGAVFDNLLWRFSYACCIFFCFKIKLLYDFLLKIGYFKRVYSVKSTLFYRWVYFKGFMARLGVIHLIKGLVVLVNDFYIFLKLLLVSKEGLFPKYRLFFKFLVWLVYVKYIGIPLIMEDCYSAFPLSTAAFVGLYILQGTYFTCVLSFLPVVYKLFKLCLYYIHYIFIVKFPIIRWFNNHLPYNYHVSNNFIGGVKDGGLPKPYEDDTWLYWYKQFISH